MSVTFHKGQDEEHGVVMERFAKSGDRGTEDAMAELVRKVQEADAHLEAELAPLARLYEQEHHNKWHALSLAMAAVPGVYEAHLRALVAIGTGGASMVELAKSSRDRHERVEALALELKKAMSHGLSVSAAVDAVLARP